MDLVDAKIPVPAMMSTKYIPFDFSNHRGGLGLHFRNSHLGPFVLTTTLLPLLKATAAIPDTDVRIVTVCSTLVQDSATHD